MTTVRIAVITAVAAAVLLAAAFALVPAASFASRAPARACGNECTYSKGWTGQPGWFETEWTTNAGFWFVRGVAVCGNGTRNTITQRGGWVTALDTFSRAACTSSYPNLDKAAYDIKTCSTCSYTRHWVTIPARPHRA